MAQLLYIEASPRKQRSHSIAVARAFLEAYRKTHPADEVQTLDVWETPLPEFNGAAIDAKYAVMHQETQSEEQTAAWMEIARLWQRFASADKYLFSLPMWNFGVPYRLKHYIDLLTQPGMAFKVDAQGYHGLLTGRPALVIYASGGSYPSGTPGAAWDFQRPYMELWLRFIGFERIEALQVAPTLAEGPQGAEKHRQEAIAKAREMAEKF
jgi:FMN-dependent NADH-azoreductase